MFKEIKVNIQGPFEAFLVIDDDFELLCNYLTPTAFDLQEWSSAVASIYKNKKLDIVKNMFIFNMWYLKEADYNYSMEEILRFEWNDIVGPGGYLSNKDYSELIEYTKKMITIV